MIALKFANTFFICYILGMFISDYPIEAATINERTQACSSGEWGCENGQCISIEKRCDGEINCSDKSDEAAELCSADNSGCSISKYMCILPPYPSHGKYHPTKGLKPGDAVPYTSLTYSCDEGYRLKGGTSPICVSGTWTADLPTCESQCKPLKSTSVDFKCYKQLSTEEISCDLPQDNNSRAEAVCKDSYHLDPPPKVLICHEGSWDYMPYCIPECGTVAPDGKNLVINGEEAKIGEFPWHVGLYDKTSTPIMQICGGNIFSPNLVITAAHCVYKELVGLHPASSFAVAAGKLYRRWNAPGDDEKFVQKIDVIKIEIPERYKGAINAHMADVAVLVLERSFVLSSFVRPICISFDYRDNLSGQLGRVAGWGLTAENGRPSPKLQTVSLPLVSFQDCYNNSPERFRPLVTSDKICAGYRNGTALCKGDSGGGLVFARRSGQQNLYYLYGIVSNSALNKEQNSCSAFAYTAFTNLIVHQEWLQNICLREWGCDNGGCISFEQRCHSGVNYCSERSDEATGFCSASDLSSSKNLCILPPYPHHGRYNATIGLTPGEAVSFTSLKYFCDEGYDLEGEGSRACVMGIWFVEAPTCEKFYEQSEMPCGMIRPDGLPEVEKRITINGTDFKNKEIPWLVTLFTQKNSNQECALADKNCWEYTCDASLISSKVLLSVGKCIHGENRLKAHAGDRETFRQPYQERFIAKTIYHPRFNPAGADSELIYDLALLVMESPYTSADNIGIICLPPPNVKATSARCEAAVRDDHKSKIYGYMKVVDTNYIDHKQCQTFFRETGRPGYVLHETVICTQGLLTEGLKDIPWGAPLMCIADGHYYVRGLSSWGFTLRDRSRGAVVYTNVNKVRDWIRKETRANSLAAET